MTNRQALLALRDTKGIIDESLAEGDTELATALILDLESKLEAHGEELPGRYRTILKALSVETETEEEDVL